MVDAEVDTAGADASVAASRRAWRPGFGDALAAGSAVLLFCCMFALAWFGVAGVPDPSYARPALSGTVDGWEAMPVVRWFVVLAVLVAVGSLLLHLSQRGHGVQTDTGATVVAFGAVACALLIWRVLIALPGGGRVVDQKLGALIGLACALGIVWGGVEMRNSQRASRETVAPPRRRRRER